MQECVILAGDDVTSRAPPEDEVRGDDLTDPGLPRLADVTEISLRHLREIQPRTEERLVVALGRWTHAGADRPAEDELFEDRVEGPRQRPVPDDQDARRRSLGAKQQDRRERHRPDGAHSSAADRRRHEAGFASRGIEWRLIVMRVLAGLSSASLGWAK